MQESQTIEQLKEGILRRDRKSLARAISLVESQKPEHKEQSTQLINEILPHTGKSQRIGISGTPGAGKSSLIEALGMQLIAQGKKLAVLAVDPSSTITQGSILGDKTRMEQLSKSEDAFIRPSPNKGYYGGIAIATYEAMLLCEAFGFDTLLVETVGVGQSETMVANIVDLFLLVAVSGGGDELQGIKRGIMERADIIFINKVDQEMSTQDKLYYNDLKRALALFPNAISQWKTQILFGSAHTAHNLNNLIESIDQFFENLYQTQAFEAKRKAQNIDRFECILQQQILDQYSTQIKAKENYIDILKKVEEGRLFAIEAVCQLLQK